MRNSLEFIENDVIRYSRNQAPFIQGHIKKFAKNHLAGILYRCVEHPESPRDEIDWRTAEAIIKANPNSINEIGARFLILKAYQCHRIHHPKDGWLEISDSFISCSSRTELERICQSIENLGSHVYESIIDSAMADACWDLKFLEKYLGRSVFDDLYGKIPAGVLGDNGYGRILFG